jgi:hypothetical protein
MNQEGQQVAQSFFVILSPQRPEGKLRGESLIFEQILRRQKHASG